jgi:hypothetical protein
LNNAPAPLSDFHVYRFFAVLIAIGLSSDAATRAFGQPAVFAGNPQHTGLYDPPAQPLNAIRWRTSINLHNTGAYAHYGAPLITASNTIVVPVATFGYQVSVYEGATGRFKYTLATDYILPSHNWIPVYQPVLANSTNGTRLYYPGAGGTVYYIEGVDSDTPGAPVQQCFYTNLFGYLSNATAFKNTVYINTPLTADTNGVIYFGFRVQGAAPAPLSTTNSGFVRMDPDGNSVYVLANVAAGDNLINRDSHNSAPALSPDGTTLYVAVKGTNSIYCYLLGLDTLTLATKYKVKLRDPRNGNLASVIDDGTASPMVGPDGDVFFGVLANPDNGSRGFMLHFSADLATQKTPSGFGWDNTAAIVPASMVPSYAGSSAYLLFTKYNNYAGNADGDGINRFALLDPNATQVDPHPTANRLLEMREVMTIIGCTPDSEYYSTAHPYAVREWCINAAAVNPATSSVFSPSEDGRIYRWDLAANALRETMVLGSGVGEPYVPTIIGPDGMVFTLNGGTMFALGGLTNFNVGLYSSAPDMRSVVTGQPVTFTAVVTNQDALGIAPAGTVTFVDLTYTNLAPITNILAAAVPLTNGIATVTTSSLAAGTNVFGNHFITAQYSGDTNFPPGSISLVQKVHAQPSLTTLVSSPASSNAVTLTAAVSSNPPGGGKPTGMVTFFDGAQVLGQMPLTNGVAVLTITNLALGGHSLSVTYASDTIFASSAASLQGTPAYLAGPAMLDNGGFQFSFSNLIAAPFTAFYSTDISVTLPDWTPLGPVTEIAPGVFQFTDLSATNDPGRFYRVRSP